MKTQRVWTQGDVVIVEEELPKDAVDIKHDGVLAYGEVTGHRHRINNGQVRFFRSERGMYAKALTDLEIIHEDHPSVRVPKGTTFRYHQEREADWLSETIRDVQD